MDEATAFDASQHLPLDIPEASSAADHTTSQPSQAVRVVDTAAHKHSSNSSMPEGNHETKSIIEPVKLNSAAVRPPIKAQNSRHITPQYVSKRIDIASDSILSTLMAEWAAFFIVLVDSEATTYRKQWSNMHLQCMCKSACMQYPDVVWSWNGIHAVTRLLNIDTLVQSSHVVSKIILWHHAQMRSITIMSMFQGYLWACHCLSNFERSKFNAVTISESVPDLCAHIWAAGQLAAWLSTLGLIWCHDATCMCMYMPSPAAS